MIASIDETYTAFLGSQHLLTGSLLSIAREIRRVSADGEDILIFSDLTGKTVDINFHGTDADVTDRFSQKTVPLPADEEQRGRGRPKLGVIGREVTLLPRHWEWLNDQPGGASVSLRKLVETARRKNSGVDQIRRSREAAYHFILAMAGDLPGFEEASRSLFAGDRPRFVSFINGWPTDIQKHAIALGFASDDADTPTSSR